MKGTCGSVNRPLLPLVVTMMMKLLMAKCVDDGDDEEDYRWRLMTMI